MLAEVAYIGKTRHNATLSDVVGNIINIVTITGYCPVTSHPQVWSNWVLKPETHELAIMTVSVLRQPISFELGFHRCQCRSMWT